MSLSLDIRRCQVPVEICVDIWFDVGHGYPLLLCNEEALHSRICQTRSGAFNNALYPAARPLSRTARNGAQSGFVPENESYM